jgi:catechol 2,3-dioxygenase
VRPLRLGHIALFTPDVDGSTRFLVHGLGMALADRSGEEVAFCCARRNSDHHVIALARSQGVGFHHASFQVNDPDEVGRAGRALVDATGAPSWGFGRHTIGSNFFHYIGDPWGSWLEYYSDMDFIEDHAAWTPRNYALEDSMSSWAPPLPPDFGRNAEIE